MHLLLLLALSTGLIAQPDVTLIVPETPVAYARSVRMRIEPPVKGEAPNNWETYTVSWDVTERSASNDPLENDLDIDSNSLKANVPTGLNPTTLKIKVSVIFVYKDYSTRVIDKTKIVTIGPGPPGPGPVVPVPPGPGPVIPTVEKFGLLNWSYDIVNLAKLPKAEAKQIGEGFCQVAGLARNGAMANRELVVTTMTERIANIQLPNLQLWIDEFLEPLRRKMNPMGPRIKTIADQATAFDEIGFGLIKYSQDP